MQGRENKRQRIMLVLVDDNLTNLTMGKNILKDIYEVYALPSAAKLFEALQRITPDLILLDIEMPEMNGYEVLCRIKNTPVISDIPVMFLTAKTDEGSELLGFSLGAIDYITKPISAPLLLKRIETHLLILKQQRMLRRYNDDLEEMIHMKTAQVLELQNTVLSTVAEMVEFRDDTTGGHVTRTQRYLQLLVQELLRSGMYATETHAWDTDLLLPSAQLHDVGKIAISDAILNKPGRLTPEEFEIMKKHVDYGINAIRTMERKVKDSRFLRYAETIAATHHERWDGKGYPRGLAGEQIPLEGRLMAIADVYDALVSTRPYKNAMPPQEAAHTIAEGGGTQFDPCLVTIFEKVAGDFAATVQDQRDKPHKARAMQASA
ncbi:MAG: response regulator [Oscillospiraceae bacterium]|jgi:putative two-component system response regulator|nr:response regulator [Oscillospiraceae bacterium]